MVYYKIEEPNGNVKYIKDVNGAEGTLEFQEDRNGCLCKDEGFFADSEFEYIKFHFKDAYPEIEHLKMESTWNRHYGEHADEPIAADAVGVGPA